MFKQFTDHARKAMAAANREAGNQGGDSFIHSEHVFLGLVPDGLADAAVRELGSDLRSLQAELRESLTAGRTQIHAAGHAKAIIESAMRIAESLNLDCIGDEHIILALTEVEGPLQAFLLSKGISYGALKKVIANLPAVSESRE